MLEVIKTAPCLWRRFQRNNLSRQAEEAEIWFEQGLLGVLNTERSPSCCLKLHQLENLGKTWPIVTQSSQPTGERLATSQNILKSHTSYFQ